MAYFDYIISKALLQSHDFTIFTSPSLGASTKQQILRSKCSEVSVSTGLVYRLLCSNLEFCLSHNSSSFLACFEFVYLCLQSLYISDRLSLVIFCTFPHHFNLSHSIISMMFHFISMISCILVFLILSSLDFLAAFICQIVYQIAIQVQFF